MNKSVCFVLIALFVFHGCASLEQRKVDKVAALEATEIWFGYLDNGDYEKLWEISSDLRKLKSSKDDLLRFLRGIRDPLGEVVDRDLQLNLDVQLIKHYPDGEYRRVVYWSKYKNKKFVREYFLIVKEGDRWAVLRYDFL